MESSYFKSRTTAIMQMASKKSNEVSKSRGISEGKHLIKEVIENEPNEVCTGTLKDINKLISTDTVHDLTELVPLNFDLSEIDQSFNDCTLEVNPTSVEFDEFTGLHRSTKVMETQARPIEISNFNIEKDSSFEEVRQHTNECSKSMPEINNLYPKNKVEEFHVIDEENIFIEELEHIGGDENQELICIVENIPANSNEDDNNEVNLNEFNERPNVVGGDENHDLICNVEKIPANANEDEANGVNVDEFSGRPKKGRKRKYENQDRSIRKKNCIQNKEYISQRGKIREEKEVRYYICSCRPNCLQKVGDENVKLEFDKFYNVESHDAQRALICSYVNEVPIKRKRNKLSEKKQFSRIYKLNDVVVCKAFFLQSLRISSCKVNSALKSLKRPEGVRDCRGKGRSKNKIDDLRVQEVVEHIKKFPRYKSHYRRSQTDREFLNEDVTLPKMYDLYKQEVANPVSVSFYKAIFLKRFNLKRKTLKKDTCNTCDRLKIEIENCNDKQKKEILESKKERHLKEAEDAQNMRKEDMKNSATDHELETLCFDLEKTLPLPRLPTNIVYYKRQLCLYNLGIHSGKYDKGHCYVWIEGEAGRGSQEVGSCLLKHIKENDHSAKKVILWSDSCGGQNRNIKIVLLMKTVLENHPSLQDITFRFLVSGHSFLPNDSDFGDIECALKCQQRIYSVDDYLNVMKLCRKKNPLIVHRMKKEEFVGTDNLQKLIVNRKTDVHNIKINWLKTREIKLYKNKPLSVFMKTDFHGDEVEIDLGRKSKRGRPSSSSFVNEDGSLHQHLVPLWPNGKAISVPKLNDIKSLISLIPNECRSFYKSLFSDNDIEDDIDGFNGALDFEIEDQDSS